MTVHLVIFTKKLKNLELEFLNEIKQRWVAEQKKKKLKYIKQNSEKGKKGSIRAEASRTV